MARRTACGRVIQVVGKPETKRGGRPVSGSWSPTGATPGPNGFVPEQLVTPETRSPGEHLERCGEGREKGAERVASDRRCCGRAGGRASSVRSCPLGRLFIEGSRAKEGKSLCFAVPGDYDEQGTAHAEGRARSGCR